MKVIGAILIGVGLSMLFGADNIVGLLVVLYGCWYIDQSKGYVTSSDGKKIQL